MKLHLITHNDLDAAGCGVVAKYICHKSAFLRQLEVDIRYNSYITIDDCLRRVLGYIRPDDVLIIGDICPSEETLDLIEQIPNTKILFDHHKTRAHLHQKYPWVHIQEGLCGTASLYHGIKKGLVPELSLYEGPVYLNRQLELFVEAVDDYDNYRLQIPESKALNRLHSAMGGTRFIQEAYEHLFEMPRAYANTLTVLEGMDDVAIKNNVANAKLSIVQDVPVAYVFTEKCISETGVALLERFPEAAAAVMINMGLGSVSVRSRKGEPGTDHLSVSHGGGGHSQASGWPIPESILTQIWDMIRD